MTGAATIAVLDIGKTNLKLSACTTAGVVVQTLSTRNVVLPGPPYRHHDLQGAGEWAMTSLADLCRRHPIAHLMPGGHGSGGVLVGPDPDAPGGGAVLPMADYEQTPPVAIDAAYGPLCGGFSDRGSAVMMAATHQARQMLWMQTLDPATFGKARWYLGVPQYWSWWLSGVAVSEATMMSAQSHLWNVPGQHWSPIVTSQNWGRLMPGFAPAWAALGALRTDIASRFGISRRVTVHAGVHDSSANFYRYQAAGMADLAVVSTGTWIVALADRVDIAGLTETRNMTINEDVSGAPLGGALTMGGREFTAVAGVQPADQRADPATVSRLIAQGTMALPTFGTDSGQFPGSAGQGRIIGPDPQSAAERLALAVLYAALLTTTCIEALKPGTRAVLDGTFLRDPAFAGLVGALRAPAETLYNPESYGVAAGAALLSQHPQSTVATLSLRQPDILWRRTPGLAAYAAHWRSLASRFDPKDQP